MHRNDLNPSANRTMSVSHETRLVNERDAATILGLKVSTLRRWRWSGDGPPHHKIGNAVRYSPADLEAFIRAGRRNSTSDPDVAQAVE